MDPEVTRDLMLRLAARVMYQIENEKAPAGLDVINLAQAVIDLDNWLTKGGFHPRAWCSKHAQAAETLAKLAAAEGHRATVDFSKDIVLRGGGGDIRILGNGRPLPPGLDENYNAAVDAEATNDPTDSAKGGVHSLNVEVDALPPDVLARLIRAAFEELVDMRRMRTIIGREEIGKRELRRVAGGIQT